MKKAYVNLPGHGTTLKEKLVGSEYLVKIEYENGEISEEDVVQYSYADVFDTIKERHEGEFNRPVRSIKIDIIR